MEIAAGNPINSRAIEGFISQIDGGPQILESENFNIKSVLLKPLPDEGGFDIDHLRVLRQDRGEHDSGIPHPVSDSDRRSILKLLSPNLVAKGGFGNKVKGAFAFNNITLDISDIVSTNGEVRAGEGKTTVENAGYVLVKRELREPKQTLPYKTFYNLFLSKANMGDLESKSASSL